MMKRLITTLFVASAIAGSCFAETRTWTDSKGRKVEAEMSGLRDGKVYLKLPTGKTIPFPIEQLSKADQEFAQNHAPLDLSTASRSIDSMVMNKLKSSYQAIVADLDKTKKTPVSATFTVKDKIKKVEELEYLQRMTYEQLDDPLSDEQFVRRIYLDIVGRIPTYTETVSFLDDRDQNKRARLIDQLLDTEGFVSHFFNYLSDLLRIREGIGMDGLNGLYAGAYADWTKDQIRQNRPWTEWVSDMLTAQGYLWDNPATGYLLTDQGMALCNLSNTFTVFAGTEITCAQCHDHPFEEVYQMDFYKMAAFFGGVNLRDGAKGEMGSAARAKHRELQNEWKEANKGKTPMPRFPNQVDDFFSSYRWRSQFHQCR
ncbi:MAG: DUF1549 domain-containing protein [Verrucomicrobiota bacterium]